MYASGLAANSVATVAPGCASSSAPQEITASSRCGEITSNRSSSPGSSKPHTRADATAASAVVGAIRGVGPAADGADRAAIDMLVTLAARELAPEGGTTP